jgi:AAA domain
MNEDAARKAKEKFEKDAGAKVPPPKGQSSQAGNHIRPLIDFADMRPDPSKTLLGARFLCVEGGLLFVGPSGIGKTSASIQQDLLWSVGKPAFGIVPAGPLKILTIQAEDDEGDLSEIVAGVKDGLQLSPQQCQQSRENCFYIKEKSHTGIWFLKTVVKPLLEKYRPSLLRINPLQAYLGGDVKDTSLTANFLRTTLNPLLAEFQCGCVIVHHTPKVTFRDTKDWKASDWMYAGAGTADITNWCRAALVIDPTISPSIFRFIAAKRASRIGWRNEATGDSEFIRHFAHADNGTIFWRAASAEEVKEAQAKKGDQKLEEKILELVPPWPLELFRPEIVELAKRKHKIGENTTRRIVLILIEKGALQVIQKPRSGTKAAEFLRRAK